MIVLSDLRRIIALNVESGVLPLEFLLIYAVIAGSDPKWIIVLNVYKNNVFEIRKS